jgi:hypothetical protein
MAVTLPASVLDRYERFTLYNSPYVAHDHGHAVDLFPGDSLGPDPEDGPAVDAPSPVGGEVVDTRTVTAPRQPYAAEQDHLVVLDTGEYVARLMHVEPAVEPGDCVAVGDSLGRLVRAGYFAPWVANHIHLGFRPHDADPYRAAGSLPLDVDPALDVEPLDWDGTGTVVVAADTYAVLDSPSHPAPDERFVGLVGETSDGHTLGVLDGGLPHYDGGGLLRRSGRSGATDRSGGGDATGRGDGGDVTGQSNGSSTAGPPDDWDRDVLLAGERVGRADGRDVTWDGVTVLANGDPVRGIAMGLTRGDAGIKLVGEGVDLPVGTEVTVEIRHGQARPSGGSDEH